MNIEEYIIESKRTATTDTTPVEDRVHSVLGFITEIAEYLDAPRKSINEAEEIGDLFWYWALLFRSLDLPSQTIVFKRLGTIVHPKGTSRSAILLADLVKREMFYKMEADYDNLILLILEIYGSLSILVKLNPASLSTILKMNIAKLYKRYPDKFNSDSALIRDLSAEGMTLERIFHEGS